MKYLWILLLLFSALGASAQNYNDPCSTQGKSFGTFSGTASAVMISGSSYPGKKIYVCHINIIVGSATNVAVVEGTGSTCATNTAAFPGLSGGTTAATGWNFAANGGIAQGSGSATIGKSATAADDVCILVSAANQTSGGFSYVVQ